MAETAPLLNSYRFGPTPTATATPTPTATATPTATFTASPTPTATFTPTPTATATATPTATPTASAFPCLINQNFEGSTFFHGYDNTETWVYSASGVDPDYATAPAPLRGAQSLRMFANDSFTYNVWAENTPDVWAFCEFQIVTLPALQSMNGLILGTDAGWLGVNINNVGSVRMGYTGRFSNASATTLSAGVHYYCWMHCQMGGTNTLYISTTTTKPGADGGGNVVVSVTDVNTTPFNQVGVWHQSTGAGASNVVYDHVLVCTTSIGNNP